MGSLQTFGGSSPSRPMLATPMLTGHMQRITKIFFMIINKCCSLYYNAGVFTNTKPVFLHTLFDIISQGVYAV